jgi:hypothetical protein
MLVVLKVTCFLGMFVVLTADVAEFVFNVTFLKKQDNFVDSNSGDKIRNGE